MTHVPANFKSILILEIIKQETLGDLLPGLKKHFSYIAKLAVEYHCCFCRLSLYTIIVQNFIFHRLRNQLTLIRNFELQCVHSETDTNNNKGN